LASHHHMTQHQSAISYNKDWASDDETMRMYRWVQSIQARYSRHIGFVRHSIGRLSRIGTGMPLAQDPTNLTAEVLLCTIKGY